MRNTPTVVLVHKKYDDGVGSIRASLSIRCILFLFSESH